MLSLSKPPTQYRCRNCWSYNDVWRQFCPVCNGTGSLIPAHLLVVQTNRVKPVATVISPLGDEPEQDVPRVSTGLANLDLLFGGGLALGSVVQLGGTPGCGKSTLLAQVSAHLGDEVLYITSEESKRRLARRFRRVTGPRGNAVDAISTIDDKLGLDEVRRAMRTHPARIVIVDSLQGLREQGSALTRNTSSKKHSQYVVRDIALALIEEANQRKLTIILTGHSTKSNELAGLREIEHMVDVVAWLRGSVESQHRQLTCSKNRDGDTAVSAHFTMGPQGLVPAAAPRRAGARAEGGEPAAAPQAAPAERRPRAARPLAEPLPEQAGEPMPERAPIRGPEIDDEDDDVEEALRDDHD